MTTVSRPVVKSVSGPDANIDHALWRSLFDDAGGIVLADGSASGNDIAHSGDLRLTLSAVDDTATVGVGYYRYRGFEMNVSPAHGLTLAAVTGSAKTYLIGVMYNPANESTTAGPLSLYAALDTAVTIPSGGSFRKLWGVTRQPSQVLSLAAKTDYRLYEGVSLWAPPGVLPADAPLGTRLHDGVDDWLRVRTAAGTGGEWQCLTRPITTALTLGGLYDGDVNLEHQDGRAALMGGAASISKKAGTPFVVGTPYSALFTIPTTSRPADTLSWIVSASTGSGPALGRLTIADDGVVTFYPITQCVSFRVEGPSWTRAS